MGGIREKVMSGKNTAASPGCGFFIKAALLPGAVKPGCGCLIAFACREAFKRGYEGWVFLLPKTYLVQHYPSKYGFTHVPIKTSERPEGIMELNTSSSLRLIKKYLD